MTDRGVSEVLGFVLVFALITGTIGVIYATGFGGLQGVQDAEKVNNVERAFDVLADNLEDLHRTAAPSRATEMNLAGGSLGTGASVEIQVRAENPSDSSENVTYNVTLEPIVYEDETGTSLVYVDGAVLRSEPGGAVMLSKPSWVIGPNRSVIQFIDTSGSGGSVGGQGTVLIVAERDGRRHLHGPFALGDGSTMDVNVTVTSPRVDAWGRFFEDEGFKFEETDPTNDSVTYSFQTERLYVPRTGIEVSFNR